MLTRLVALLLLALALSACGAPAQSPTPAPTTPPTAEPTAAPPTAEPTALPPTAAPTDVPAEPAQDKNPLVVTTEVVTAAPTTPALLVQSLEEAPLAVVRIEAEGAFIDPAYGAYSGVGSGSGFIITPDGLVVTNNHVVTGAALLRVWLSGEARPRNARILGVSECSDLAVIDIDGDGLRYLDWHTATPTVGLDVYTAGYPLDDPEITLTRGIVSKARADGESTWSSVDYVLEHDATINPGNSGGPLLDTQARVVGINYAAIADANIYYAVAWAEAERVLESLRQDIDITSIGLNAEAYDDGAGTVGLWVYSVGSGSAADRAGVRAGDVVLTLEHQPLATDGTMATYCDILRTHVLDDVLAIDVLRGGERWAGQINGVRLVRVAGAQPPAATGGTTGGGGATLTLVNASGESACYVYISPSTSDSWGDDWLGASEVLADGDRRSFTLTPDSYDVRADTCDHTSLLEQYGVQVTGTVELTIGAGGGADGGGDDRPTNAGTAKAGSAPSDGSERTVTVDVINDGVPPICSVQIYDAVTDALLLDWVVADSALTAGDGISLDVQTAATLFDIRVLDCDLAPIDTRSDVAIDREYSWVMALPQVTVTLVNNSGRSVCAVYMVPANSDEWGYNWLPEGDSVPAGGNIAFTVAQEAAYYDLRALDCNGNMLDARLVTPLEAQTTWLLPPLAAQPQPTTPPPAAGATQIALTLVNHSGGSVCYVYISPSTSDSWGNDWLGSSEIIAAGASRVFRFAPLDTPYDLRATDCAGETLAEQYGVPLYDGFVWEL